MPQTTALSTLVALIALPQAAHRPAFMKPKLQHQQGVKNSVLVCEQMRSQLCQLAICGERIADNY
eukprot:8565-Heterococcus_DN1.PRE.5